MVSRLALEPGVQILAVTCLISYKNMMRARWLGVLGTSPSSAANSLCPLNMPLIFLLMELC